MSGTLRKAAGVLTLSTALTLTGCDSLAEDVAQARIDEQRAEQVLQDALDLPDGTEGREALIADARATEAELERIREAVEAMQLDRLGSKAIDLVGHGATGNYFGLIEGLGAVLTGAATYFLATRKSGKETQERLADLERRRDESRALQGIAKASDRSVAAQASAVAQAAKRAEADRLLDALEERMTARAPQPFRGVPTAASTGYGIDLPPESAN